MPTITYDPESIDKMNVKVKNGLYQIEIPPPYKHEEDGDKLAVYDNADGLGALSITSYGIPQDYSFITTSELQDFIWSIDSSAILTDTDCKPEYCRAEFLDSSDRYWRVWVLFSNNRAVFISYNCDNSDKDVERTAVDKIVRSIVPTA